MKFLICIAFCLSSLYIIAQPPVQFIEDKAVQWAAFSPQNFHFSIPNLSLLLRQQFSQGKIAVRLPDQDGINAGKAAASKEQVINRIAPGLESALTDPLFSFPYFDSSTNNLLEVQQVLYLEKGILKSFVYSAAPKFKVVTPSMTELGVSNVFFTAFNKDRSLSRRIKKDAYPVGTTSTYYKVDSFLKTDMLKQTYGRNLAEAVWTAVSDKKAWLYHGENDSLLTMANADSRLLDFSPVAVPVYDANGNLTSRNVELSPLAGATFTGMLVQQQWFYNERKNILYNNILSLTFFAKKWLDDGYDTRDSPIVKLVYK